VNNDVRLEDLPEPVIQAYLSFPQRNEFLPVRFVDDTLSVWALKPRALAFADYMAWMLGVKIDTDVVPEDQFYRLLEKALLLWEEEHTDQEGDIQDLDDEVDSQELIGWSHEDAPIVRLVNKILQEAINRGASDVHFEGQTRDFLVRMRLDGELHDFKSLNKALQPTVLARIKVMGEMDVAENRAPQDGRIQVRLAKKMWTSACPRCLL